LKEVPFTQKSENGKLVRTFEKNVDDEELVWHRDRKDRLVKVISGKNWKLQLDDELPVYLQVESVYLIPSERYHRIIKGDDNLIVEIEELD
jgi:hypothetical protein